MLRTKTHYVLVNIRKRFHGSPQELPWKLVQYVKRCTSPILPRYYSGRPLICCRRSPHLQPDNWEEETRFDGPEHWGMEERWKSLFPETGFKTKSSGGISDSSSAGDSDGGRTRKKGTRKVTVDITEEEEGDDPVSLLSGEDTDQLANFKQPRRAVRRAVPETAPEDPEEEWPVPSYRRPKAKKTAISCGSINATSTGRAPRDEEATTGQRRWRTQPRSTEPASSSRAGRRGEWRDTGNGIF